MQIAREEGISAAGRESALSEHGVLAEGWDRRPTGRNRAWCHELVGDVMVRTFSRILRQVHCEDWRGFHCSVVVSVRQGIPPSSRRDTSVTWRVGLLTQQHE
jgi:hypothetical protein